MNWITYHYHPGFADDLTSWEIIIDREGNLTQTVKIRRPQDAYSRSEKVLTASLNADQMQTLKALIAKTDFEAVEKSKPIIDDAPQISVAVHDDAGSRGFEARLPFWAGWRERMHSPGVEIAAAIWLASAIEEFGPWKGHG